MVYRYSENIKLGMSILKNTIKVSDFKIVEHEK